MSEFEQWVKEISDETLDYGLSCDLSDEMRQLLEKEKKVRSMSEKVREIRIISNKKLNYEVDKNGN